MRGSGVICLVAALGLTGCELGIGPALCTTDAPPSFEVTVLDDATGENLAPDAIVWVRDGAFVDTLVVDVDVDSVYYGFFDRSGTYEVVAEHEGYVDWRRTGVEVEDGECHVITRELTARLTPAP
ncbi:MAG TPA: hypothetical protein VF212_00720 [Longimicrobiales bacterium]